MKRLRYVLLGLMIGAGVLPHPAAADVTIKDVRYGRHENGLYRMVLDLNEAVDFRRSTRPDGTVVIHLRAAGIRPGLGVQGYDRRFVRGLRIQPSSLGALDILVRPRSGLTVRVFQLEPHRDHGWRLVIDLQPGKISPGSTQAAASAEVEIEPVSPPPAAKPAIPPVSVTTTTDEGREMAVETGSESSLSGNVSIQLRGFADSGNVRQHGSYLSAAIEPEWYWARGDNSLTVTPFYRWDQYDSERSHFDMRELMFVHVGDGWEIHGGIGKVFWGVTEANHLVDIINQTDLVENVDGEQKLGQPMLRLSLEREWGTVDVFAMTGFRERTFPGAEGRFLYPLPVATDLARYSDGRDQWSPDLAIRWSHFIGDWDIGLAHFHGTGREPEMLPALDGAGNPVLIPVYPLIDQTSLDLQATKGDWLWKLEAIRRSGQGDPFFAAGGGFEYTFVGIADSASDVGALLEIMLDERGDDATTPFNHDLFAGMRWTANDVQSTELLAGVIFDWQTDAQMFNLEGSRRIGEAWKLSVQARAWMRVSQDPLLSTFGKDDYVEVQMARYF